MPVYEYRCDTCATTFELRRAIAEAGAPTTCPDGHVGARRVLSVFATTGRARTGRATTGRGAAPAPAGGCGANCACAAAR